METEARIFKTKQGRRDSVTQTKLLKPLAHYKSSWARSVFHGNKSTIRICLFLHQFLDSLED